MSQINFDLTENNEDKVLSKRHPTSASMTLQMELPGSKILANGIHTIGFLEGNIAITKVSLVTKVGFDGTTPVVTITNLQNGVTETWLTAADISIAQVEESDLTIPDAVTGKKPPYYRSTKSEWFADITTGLSTIGEFSLLIDYVQLDTEPGKHS